MADIAKPHEHHAHTSVWPFLAALGLTLTSYSAILMINKNPVGWMFGAIGVLFFLISVGSWLIHMTREDIAEVQGLKPVEYPKIGLWLVAFLILSEIFLFGCLFASYFYLRGHDFAYTQSPLHFYLVDNKVIETMGPVPLLNTIWLVSSSFVLHFAEEALKKSKMVLHQILMGITILLGMVFIGGQVYEFVEFIYHENFSILSGPFGAAFYSLTGLHGVHVVAGVILLLYMFVGSFVGQLSAKRHMALTVVSIYWHFVDVIWIFLLSALYLRLF